MTNPMSDLMTDLMTVSMSDQVTDFMTVSMTDPVTDFMTAAVTGSMTDLIVFFQLVSFGNKNKAGEFYLYPIPNSVLIEFHLKWKTYFQDEGGRQAEISHKLRE